MAVFAGGLDAAASQQDPASCVSGSPPAASPEYVALPEEHSFPPPIAGAGEPRIALAWARIHLPESPALSGTERRAFAAGIVSGGGVFGLWARRDNCTVVQVSLLGGVFSQSNLDEPSQALINSDFLIGGQVTYRGNSRVSARVRVYHQSSHLGDEFLLSNPDVRRLNFGFQAIDALMALDEEWWRAYIGGGLLFFTEDELSPGMLRAGVEVGGGKLIVGGRLVAALDLTAHQALDWHPAVNGAGGLEWSASSGGRRLRALAIAFDGPNAYGQFFDQETRHLGLQLQFEF
jgi:hypothetical protein